MVVVLGGLLLLGERAAQVSPFPLFKKETLPPAQVTTEEQSLITALNKESLGSIALQKNTINSMESKLSYAEAVELYANATIQFTDGCQLASKGRSFRLGTEVMIDNRSPQPRTITIGTLSLVVGPYDYGFMILNEKGTSVSVSCNDRANVAELMVQ